jgi:hypothetical protein
MPARFMITLSLIAVAASTQAQSPVSFTSAGGQIRDAAYDASAKRIYAAAYNMDEVWAVDGATRQVVSKTHVGKGPVALALSEDHSILACVNRLDNSVSLLRLPGLEVYATLQVGDGPTGISTLPGQRFAVADTFSDSVSLIDGNDQGSVTPLRGAPPVPTATAVSEGYLGVIGRSSAVLHLYALSDLSNPIPITLPDIPVRLLALPKDRFIAATKTTLYLVDAASQGLGAQRDLAVDGLCSDQTAGYALSGSAIQTLDDGLNTTATIDLGQSSTGLSVRDGVFVALAPQIKSWAIWGALQTATVQAAPKKQEKAALLAAPPATGKKKAKSVPAPAPAPVSPTEEPTSKVAPVPQHPDIVGTLPAPAPNPVKNALYLDPFKQTTAPQAGKPSTVPSEALSRGILARAIQQPTQFGSKEGGFEPPDWTNPARDVTADKMVRNLETGITTMENNVRLKLGNMLFTSDAFTRNEKTGEVHVQGHVEVTQTNSKFTAEDVKFWPPDPGEVPPPSPLLPVGEQEAARKRLSLGRVEATKVHIVEPTREMIADHATYDFGKGTGVLTGVVGHAGMYYFSAQKVTLTGPKGADCEGVWITTCDEQDPHYRITMKTLNIKDGVEVESTKPRLMIGHTNTPVYLPKWSTNLEEHPWNIDFRTGRTAELGYFVEYGQMFEITPNIALGPRIFPSEKGGVGVGGDVNYDFMQNPASPFFSSKGEIHGLYTTRGRDYVHWYHRYEYSDDLVVKGQLEWWKDPNAYKNLYYLNYKNRTDPRTFVNLTYRQDEYIATATVRENPNNWSPDTERLPEGTFHLLERPLVDRLTFSFDTIDGYNKRTPKADSGARSVNVGRLTYNYNPVEGISLTPFFETEAALYTGNTDRDEANALLAPTLGATLQTRLHRMYPGVLGFSDFKHLIVPSVTAFYRSQPLKNADEVARFDALDNPYGRARIESKIDNILYGRDANTKETWQVARLSLYHGNDMWNEQSKAQDYEMELDLRPRSWGGFQTIAERHEVDDNKNNKSDPACATIEDWYYRTFERGNADDPLSRSVTPAGSFTRLLTQVYYDSTPKGGRSNGRIGFAYTETNGSTFNKDMLYSLGMKLGDNWSAGFEHVFDIEHGHMRMQIYELRRKLHCWELDLRFIKRESGIDVNVGFNLVAFPSSRVRF